MNSQRTRLRSPLAVILTVLVLLPIAVLFVRVWQENSDQRSQTDLEKKGIEYITALSPLISALTEAQSSALQGVSGTPESLTAAMTNVAAVDQRLGEDLKTRERWADLQSKIANLANISGGGLAVYQAHVEVTDLTLALYGAVRRNAELSLDPDTDISALQQAVTADMPSVLVLVSQMGDVANLLQTATGTARAALSLEFGEKVIAVEKAVNALTESLQAAVDSTDSATLSGSLVNTLDSFRRGVETMTRGANPGGRPNIGTISTAQTALQSSLNTLSGVTLREMEGLLDDRMDGLNYRRGEALLAGLLALLLVLGAVLWPIFGRRSPAPPAAAPDDPPAGRAPGAYGPQYDLQPNFGEFDPTRRERSGALR
jgi:hypothetical protein